MSVPKKLVVTLAVGLVVTLAVGLVVIATFHRCEAQSDGNAGLGPALADIPADAEVAVKTAETNLAVLEAKWAPAVLEISRQIENDRQRSKRSQIWIGMLAKINTTQSQDLLRRIATTCPELTTSQTATNASELSRCSRPDEPDGEPFDQRKHGV